MKWKSLESLLSTVLLTSSLALPSPARAQYQDLKPGEVEKLCTSDKECYAIGKEAYEQGHFRKAAELFKRSYTLAPKKKARSILLYNVALAYENGGKPGKAVFYYDEYLKEMPEAAEKNEIEKKIPGLRLYVKGKEFYQAGKFRQAREVFGEAHSLLPYDKVRAALRFDLEACRKNIKSLEQEKEPAAERKPKLPAAPGEKAISPPKVRLETTEYEPPLEIETFWKKYRWTFVSGGLAGALGVTGYVFNQKAGDKFSHLRNSCAPDCSDGEIDDLRGQVKMRNLAYGAGITAALIGGALFAWESLGRDSGENSVKIKSSGMGVKVKF